MNLHNNLALSEKEDTFYKELYNGINLDKKNETMKILFLNSCLSQENLKKIWILSSQSKAELEEKDFNLYLKCISIIQNNEIINENNIKKEFPIPFFNGKIYEKYYNKNYTNQIFELNNEKILLLLKYINNCKCKKKGFLNSQEAIELGNKSDIDKKGVTKIWKIIQKNITKELNTQEFIIFIFLISKFKQGFEIPNILPLNLEKFIIDFDINNYIPNNSNLSLNKFKEIQIKSNKIINEIRQRNSNILKSKLNSIEQLEELSDKLECNLNSIDDKENHIKTLISNIKSNKDTFKENIEQFYNDILSLKNTISDEQNHINEEFEKIIEKSKLIIKENNSLKSTNNMEIVNNQEKIIEKVEEEKNN